MDRSRSSAGVPADEFSAVELLDLHGPHGLAELIVETATELAGCEAGLYVIELAGAALGRVRASADFPERIAIRQAVGPELPLRQAAQVVGQLEPQGWCAQPLWLRGRATALLLTRSPPASDLSDFAREAAAAIDMADRYTDVFEKARRPLATSAAAEMQVALLPPRLTRVPGGELAGTVLPAYDMGGDWFDYADGGSEVWLAVGDARGKGPQAAALSGLAVGGLRAVRRQGGSLLDVAKAVDDAVGGLADPTAFVTAILATWDPVARRMRWLNCGHAPPLIVSRDGSERECDDRPRPPLGLGWLAETASLNEVELFSGDRVLLYTDGVDERRTREGRLGRDGLRRALATAESPSAGSLVTSLLETVRGASTEDLEDDATVLVLKVH